eukprot:1257977-Alexandrium_andersonii.AAC.1
MSASLVGSEMCIRDSPCDLRCRLPSDTPFGSRAARAAPVLPAPVSVHSVSYTHLTLPTICSV